MIKAFLLIMPLFAELNFGGKLELYNRYLMGDSARWTLNRAEFTLNTEADLGDHLHIRVENTFTSENFPVIFSSFDLTEEEKVDPVTFSLGEAYADIYGFLLPDLDLRIGRQIINWGTADKVNPTSNFNPYDLSDFLSFGDRLPVNAIRAFFNLDPLNLELGFVPVFKPSLIPVNEYTERLFSPQGVENFTSFTELPDRNLSNSSLGAKISGNFHGWDLSLSFYRGQMKFPVPDSIFVVPGDRVIYYAGFPKFRVLGFDFAGSIFKAGLWGELGIFFPDKHILKTVTECDTILKNFYVKYVFGTDYTFKDGTYFNFQFIHGFFNEFGDSLHDYITFRVERKFWNDRLKVAPLGIALEVSDWSKSGKNYGYILNPSITFRPYDNLEIDAGSFIIDGRGKNMLSRIKDVDEVYLKFKISY